MIEIVKPKEMHEWYLEAIKNLKSESFNPNANKSFEELTKEQQSIDNFISKKVNDKIQLEVNRANKWIEIRFLESKPKTEVWGVYPKNSAELIGVIKWFPNWRHYCFFPEKDTVFSDGCQLAIGFFIMDLNKNKRIIPLRPKGTEYP